MPSAASPTSWRLAARPADRLRRHAAGGPRRTRATAGARHRAQLQRRRIRRRRRPAFRRRAAPCRPAGAGDGGKRRRCAQLRCRDRKLLCPHALQPVELLRAGGDRAGGGGAGRPVGLTPHLREGRCRAVPAERDHLLGAPVLEVVAGVARNLDRHVGRIRRQLEARDRVLHHLHRVEGGVEQPRRRLGLGGRAAQALDEGADALR